MKNNPFVAWGAVFAFFAVVLGAFGAHALKDSLTPNLLTVYRTATDYQMWHAIGLILIGLLHQQNPSSLLRKSGWFMLGGIVIFSGSLYALSLSGLKVLGAITPVGGLLLIAAWLLLFFAAIKSN
ncbi:MAG: hypothetical protein A6F71_06050 [Cycloclasticus sp. symbiont of Poecilosclerida sp. M]|nr:MAG: hypothetical protein A6F71_06050 [Cycloclasticus sp. symbiont of Poecilosclerida sp. M]